MKKKIKELIIIHCIVIVLLFISEFADFRICIIYNLFGIPCFGCGITRGIVQILHGDIVSAIKYNYLSIILLISYIVSMAWIIIDLIRKKETFRVFLKKYSKILIFLATILVIVAEIINILNPLLY